MSFGAQSRNPIENRSSFRGIPLLRCASLGMTTFSLPDLDRFHQLRDIIRLIELPAKFEHAIRGILADLRRGEITELSFEFRILEPVPGVPQWIIHALRQGATVG